MQNWADIPLDEEKKPRRVLPQLPHEVCCTCFDEVKKGYSEEQAKAEAERCLNCGICSECMQCVTACPAQAVTHDQAARHSQPGGGLGDPGAGGEDL